MHTAEQILEKLLGSANSAQVIQKCVYALEMSNNTTKIGSTQNFQERVRQIQSASGLSVTNSFHTEYFEKELAVKVEKTCHETFSEQKVQGEYFAADFQEVKVERIYNSELLNRDDALRVEKLLHDKFDAQRLEGEFFNVPFAKAARELERIIAELHLFEPLALPDPSLADKLFSYAAQISDVETKDKILIHAANLLVGKNVF